jgi:hypothetical protein
MKSTRKAEIAVLILLGVLTLSPHGAAAQTANSQAADSVQPKVTGLEGNLEADDLITVQIDHLAEWAGIATNSPAKLVPYLNGIAMRGNYPAEIHTSKDKLVFHLQITSQNKKEWVAVLGAPEGLHRPVTVSVGLEGQSPFDSVYDESNRVLLTVISPWYGVIALIIVLATLILLVLLARTTNIIREPGPKPVGGKLRPYNLGRTQMAFWFFLIYASYTVIWLITDALDTITPSLLALMGISAATALSEALIDSGKNASKAGQVQNLTAEKQALEQTIPELQAQFTAVQAKDAITPDDLSNLDNLSNRLESYRARLGEINKQIESTKPAKSTGISAGFLRDILGDANGYSFHRFQIFAWMIVLGVIFVSSVYNGLTMPEFNTTLLGLMGISSGTYIGFKFPEQR